MKYICTLCGWVYDEEKEGTNWDDLDTDYLCPACGAGKEAFEPADE